MHDAMEIHMEVLFSCVLDIIVVGFECSSAYFELRLKFLTTPIKLGLSIVSCIPKLIFQLYSASV